MFLGGDLDLDDPLLFSDEFFLTIFLGEFDLDLLLEEFTALSLLGLFRPTEFDLEHTELFFLLGDCDFTLVLFGLLDLTELFELFFLTLTLF